MYDYEAAFGAADQATRAMQNARKLWQKLYYQQEATRESDPHQRIAYTVVSKLARAVFGEYTCRGEGPVADWLAGLDRVKNKAMQLALLEGECYIKPCPLGAGFSYTLIPRENILVFARDRAGEPVDVGTAEKFREGQHYFTLLERRTRDAEGLTALEYRLFRSGSRDRLGEEVALSAAAGTRHLQRKSRFPLDLGGVGLVRMVTPMVNCVDGSGEGVAVFAPAAQLIDAVDRNEAELSGEFARGRSRILVSADMLRDGVLTDSVFVGLDEDPETAGVTIFSPQLREQSYLARKQEYLRNIESVIGLKRGMLSDANVEERTATEIAASNADYCLTVMELQAMWRRAAEETVALCSRLTQCYGGKAPADLTVAMDFGNGVLYDQEAAFAGLLELVQAGLLKPEIALGQRFGMKTDTAGDLAAVREKLMP